jgi:hypothetical protein
MLSFDISPFKLKLNETKRAKNISLRMDYAKKLVILTFPNRKSEKTALKFLEKNKTWILKHIKKTPESKNPTIGNNKELEFIGEKYIITHLPHQKGGVWVENNKICVTGNKEFLKSRIERFLKKEIKKYITQKTNYYAKQIGKKINRISIKDTTSRWGSCTSDGNLSFSWRICFAPVIVIDYLCAHEVAHLKEMNHSKVFWNLVDKLMSEKKETKLVKPVSFAKFWLKTHGANLHAI